MQATPRKKPRKRKVHYEDMECDVFVEGIQLCWPWLYPYVTHIANEGKRGAASAARLEKLGMKPGVPDYFFFYPCGKFHGLAIEMKKSMKFGGSKPVTTPKQKEWIMRLREVGYAAYVCEGAEEALSTVKKYISLK